MSEEDLSLVVPRWVWPLVVLALVLTAWAALFICFGAIVTAPVVLAAAAAFGLWMTSTYRQPRFRRILPLYITLVIVLMLLGLEQWSLGYSEILAAMFPAHFAAPVLWSPRLHLGVFTLGFTTIFLFASVGIFFHHPLGNYAAWLLMMTAVIGGLWLFLAPLAAGRIAYLPGMGMAAVAMVLGVVGALRLLRARSFNHEVLQ